MTLILMRVIHISAFHLSTKCGFLLPRWHIFQIVRLQLLRRRILLRSWLRYSWVGYNLGYIGITRWLLWFLVSLLVYIYMGRLGSSILHVLCCLAITFEILLLLPLGGTYLLWQTMIVNVICIFSIKYDDGRYSHVEKL